MMKRISFRAASVLKPFLVLCALTSPTAAPASQEADAPDNSRQTAGRIVLPAQAGPAMTFAAHELGRYLGQMTGSNWLVDSGTGTGESLTILLATDASLAPDGYRIAPQGDRITIAGGNGRGCLFGCYAWLRLLGCRWSLPGREFESVPRIGKVRYDVPLTTEPVIRRRGMVYCIQDPNDRTCIDLVDFLAKNGFNYLFLHANELSAETQKRLADALNQREMGFEFGGHRLPALLPRELFDEHPEYFRMHDGQRTPHLNMCPSSEGALDVIARHALTQYLDPLRKDFHTLETLHLWPDDLFHGGWCGCPSCKPYSDSEQSLLVLNRIADRLPLNNTMLAHCAYHVSILPPEKVAAHPGVRLMYAPRERSYLRPLDTCGANQWYHDCLIGLIKAAPRQPEVFEYYHDMILFRALPIPLHRIIGEDVRAYRQAGIDGIASLSFQGYDRYAYGPNTYVLGRALWRGTGSPADIRAYCEDIYGPAANLMETYFDLLFELCSTAMDTCEYTGFVDLRQLPPEQPGVRVHAAKLAPLVTARHLDHIGATLQNAFREAGASYRSRVRIQQQLWQFVRHETQTIHKGIRVVPLIQQSLGPMGTTEQCTDAIQRVEEIIRDIDKGTEILLRIPADVRGPFAQEGSGVINERVTGYKHSPNVALATLKARRKELIGETREDKRPTQPTQPAH